MARRGRPRLTGPRYPSGRLRRTDERGEALWCRLRDYGAQIGADPRLMTPLGRLGMSGQLTPRQMDTALMIGRIYGQYEALVGRRRTPAGPGYVRLIPDVGGAATATALPDDRRERKIIERFLRLQRVLDGLPDAGRCRAQIEALCVDERHLPAIYLPDMRAALDYIAQRYSGRRSAAV